MAAPFDLRRLALAGAASPVIEGILPLQYSFSSTGSLVYVPGSVQITPRRMVWVDRKGGEQPLSAPLHSYVMPRISPDGRRVAAAIEEAESQIWVYDLGRDTLTRLTFDGGANVDPRRLVITIMGAVSQWEREAIGERTRDALRHKRTSGERVGNIRFGFRLSPDGKHVEPDPGEQAVLTEIRDLRQHGHTLRGIAAALNRRALRTRRGSAWRLEHVARIIKQGASR